MSFSDWSEEQNFETSLNLTNKDEALFYSCDIKVLPRNTKEKIEIRNHFIQLIFFKTDQLYNISVVSVPPGFLKMSSCVISEVF